MKPKTLTWNEKPFRYAAIGAAPHGFPLLHYVGQFPVEHKFYANKWTASIGGFPLRSAPKGTPELFETREEAEAACQADFDSRVWELVDK